MTLQLPDLAPDPYGDGLAFTPAMHLDAVRHQLAQARCLADVTPIEADLWDAHRTRMRKGVARPWINEALALCAQRRDEIREVARRPAHPSPAVPGIPERS
jgi:hypothetical protein